jgi:predicted nucleic acid-binding protein
MRWIFIDTNGWVALNSKNDLFHEMAVYLNRKLLKDNYRYVTTNFVLDETYTCLSTRVSHYSAVDFGEKIRQAKTVQMIHVNNDIEDMAWTIFKQYSDKDFSFTDCTSFVVMRQLSITSSFTNDHHFEQMGFTALLKKT